MVISFLMANMCEGGTHSETQQNNERCYNFQHSTLLPLKSDHFSIALKWFNVILLLIF